MSLRMVAFQSWPLTNFFSMFAHVLLLIGLGRSSLLAAFLATVICFFWPSAVLFLHINSFTSVLRILLFLMSLRVSFNVC